MNVTKWLGDTWRIMKKTNYRYKVDPIKRFERRYSNVHPVAKKKYYKIDVVVTAWTIRGKIEDRGEV